MKRKFEVEFFVTATIILDEAVINVVDDEWRSQLYNLNTPEEIAQHIAYNMLANGVHLKSLDGWGDQPNENAEIEMWPNWENEDCKEIIEEPK